MAVELKLEEKYNVLRLGVISSNSISSRATVLIKHLTEKKSDGKIAVACLHAKASVANKLISAVEIAKRDLLEKKLKVFQYTELSFESTTLKPGQKHIAKGKKLPGNDEVDEGGATSQEEEKEDEAFEVMRDVTDIKRDVPVLTVYLSLSPVKALRDTFGEQVD